MTELAATSAIAAWPLTRRVMVTLLIMAASRIPDAIPLPGIDPSQLRLDRIGHAALVRTSLGALGLTPYVTAWIGLNVIQRSMPRQIFEGPRLERAVRCLTLVLALLQGFLIGTALHSIELGSDVSPITIALALAASQLFLVWLGDLVTRHGIGFGMPLIVATPLLAALPDHVWQSFEVLQTGAVAAPIMVVLLAAIAATVFATVFFAGARYNLPVTDAGNAGTRPLYLTLTPAGIAAAICGAIAPASMDRAVLSLIGLVDPYLADTRLVGTLIAVVVSPLLLLSAMTCFGPPVRGRSAQGSADAEIRHLTLVLSAAGGALLAPFVAVPDIVALIIQTRSPISGSQLMLLTFVALACLRRVTEQER